MLTPSPRASDANAEWRLAAILCCALVALVDGFDTQAIAFVAPLIARDWHIDIASFGPIFAMGLFGGLIGAIGLGAVADRRGRRPALIGALVLVALGTLGTPFAMGWNTLLACRFVAGVGLGGALPGAIALTAEFAPGRFRHATVTAMFCCFPFGAVLGAIASGPVLAHHDWRWVFWLGGVIPVVTIPLTILFVPESLNWSAPEAVRRSGRGTGFLEAFREGRALITMSLALSFLLSLLLVYLLINWMPSLAVRAGYSVREGALTSAALNLCGIGGGLVIAAIGDRFSASRAIAGAYVIGAIMAFAMVLSGRLTQLIFPFSIVAGFFCVGAQMSLVSLAASYYPALVRARAIGLLMAVGRIGAIIGPLIGGRFIGGPAGIDGLAYVIASASLLTGVAVLLPALMTTRPARDPSSSDAPQNFKVTL